MTKAIMQQLRALEQRMIALQEATDRNTEQLADIRQAVERLEGSPDPSEAASIPLQEDVDDQIPGKGLAVRQLLDGFRRLVGLEPAKQPETRSTSSPPLSPGIGPSVQRLASTGLQDTGSLSSASSSLSAKSLSSSSLRDVFDIASQQARRSSPSASPVPPTKRSKDKGKSRTDPLPPRKRGKH
jgi:hypothetical protein